MGHERERTLPIDTDCLAALESRIGYRFRDRALLCRALTHSSYSNETGQRNHHLLCNERLEFLGDSVLSLVVSEFLFTTYRELPEGKVLFICTFDPFGLGYVKYSFQNRCEENQELCLRDGTEKIFYNCVSNAEEVPEHLKELYDYIRTGRAESALTRKIEEAVGRARRNEEWRTQYMKELLHDDDVREEGRAEGRAEERSLLLTLIPRMTAGGDGDKIAQLESPEVLEAMQRKYGLNFATLQDSGKKV